MNYKKETYKYIIKEIKGVIKNVLTEGYDDDNIEAKLNEDFFLIRTKNFNNSKTCRELPFVGKHYWLIQKDDIKKYINELELWGGNKKDVEIEEYNSIKNIKSIDYKKAHKYVMCLSDDIPNLEEVDVKKHLLNFKKNYGKSMIDYSAIMNYQLIKLEKNNLIQEESSIGVKGEEIVPEKFVYHKSNSSWRSSIQENGIETRVGDCYLTYIENEKGYSKCNPAIFATNTKNPKELFDTTFDDDVWRIDTSKIYNKWYEDANFYGFKKKYKHIVTFDDIPQNALSLIYKGTGKDYDDMSDEEYKKLCNFESGELDENYNEWEVEEENVKKEIESKLKDIKKRGFTIGYRVIWVKDIDDIDKKELGNHFVSDASDFHEEMVDYLFNNARKRNKYLKEVDDAYLITVKIKYNLIDIDGTILTNIEHPFESEIITKENSLVEIIKIEKFYEVDEGAVNENLLNINEGIKLYHGTNNDNFDKFDINKSGLIKSSDWGNGIYLTRSKGIADMYRIDAVKHFSKEYNDAYDDYIKIEKDLKKEKYGTSEYYKLHDLSNNAVKKFQEIGRKLNFTKEGKVIVVELNEDAKIYRYNSGGGMTDPYLAERVKSKGYDVILVDEGKFTEEYVVLNPDVIKIEGNNSIDEARKIVKTILKEAFKKNIIAYHISEYDFDKFNSSENIGNFGTVLDGSYFLSTINGLDNFGTDGFIYKVELNPKQMFTFDLRTDEHWYLTTEFQELFSESLAGISNYLDDFFEEQNIDSVDDIDCIALTSIDYLNNKNTIEYIVLDDNIINIINKTEVE